MTEGVRRKRENLTINCRISMFIFVCWHHLLSSTYDLVSKTIRYAVSVRWEREQRERRGQIFDSSGPIRRPKQAMFTCTIEDFHKYFCCCAKRVGTMFFSLEKRDGTPILVAGPCWPFCTFVTVPLIIVLSGLVAYFIVLDPEMGLVRSFFFSMFLFRNDF